MGGDTTTRPRRATWDVTTPDESIAMKLERLDAVSLRKVVERACRVSFKCPIHFALLIFVLARHGVN